MAYELDLNGNLIIDGTITIPLSSIVILKDGVAKAADGSVVPLTVANADLLNGSSLDDIKELFGRVWQTGSSSTDPWIKIATISGATGSSGKLQLTLGNNTAVSGDKTSNLSASIDFTMGDNTQADNLNTKLLHNGLDTNDILEYRVTGNNNTWDLWIKTTVNTNISIIASGSLGAIVPVTGVFSSSVVSGYVKDIFKLWHSGNIEHINVDKPSQIIKGNVSLSNLISTQTSATRTYIGNGTTQDIIMGDADGPELIISSDDRTFTTDTGNWTKGGSWVISGGQATHTVGSGDSLIYINKIFEIGKHYEIKYDVISYTSGNLYLANSITGNANLRLNTSVGSHTMALTYGGTPLELRLYSDGTITIDNISVKEITNPIASYDFTDNTNPSGYYIIRGSGDNFNVISNTTIDELVDGDFTDTLNWTKGTGWTVTGGQAVATAAANGSRIEQTITPTIVGKKYAVTYTVSGYSAGGIRPVFWLTQGATNDTNIGPTVSANGTYLFEFEATQANTWFSLQAVNTTTLNIDIVSVKEVVESGECELNTSKVHIKSRSEGITNYTGHNLIFDGLRGATNYIGTNYTDAEAQNTAGFMSFNINGFSVGTALSVNYSGDSFVAYQTLYTHIRWGVTNHGKKYVEAYNPVTLDTMIMYEGSGISGHEIPHSLGRKLAYEEHKNLSTTDEGRAVPYDSDGVSLGHLRIYSSDGTPAIFATTLYTSTEAYVSSNSDTSPHNADGNNYILYGFANAYYNEKGDLVGTKEVGTYVGTGATGNKVYTKGMPANLITKTISTTDDWRLYDINTIIGRLALNLPDAETGSDHMSFESNGFTFNSGNANILNAQYLYIVEYDTKLNGGGSYADLPSDTTQLNTTDVIMGFANGKDNIGLRNSTITIGSITIQTGVDVTYNPGTNYLHRKGDGTFGVTPYAPEFGTDDGFGDVYNLDTNELYPTTAVFADDFSTDTSGDYSTDDSASITVENGKLKLENVDGGRVVRKSFNVTIGKKYKIYLDYDVSKSTNIAGTRVKITDQTDVDITYFYNTGDAYGTTQTVTAPTSTINLKVSIGTIVGDYILLDNIAIIPLNDDGSIDFSAVSPYTGANNRSYLAKVMADAGGEPYAVEKFDSGNVVKTLTVQDTLKIRRTEWLDTEGEVYLDEGLLVAPDTTFSPTGARIYPDGTIRGKSASYGEYVKYPDGTLVCTNTSTTVVNLTTSFDGVYYGTNIEFLHPVQFVSTPSSSVNMQSSGRLIDARANTNNTIKSAWYPTSNASRSSLTVISAYMAIGKWK